MLVHTIKSLDAHHRAIVEKQQAKAKDPKKTGTTVNGRMINTDLL